MMKKQIVLTLITSAFLLMAGTTQAGGSGYGYRGSHSGGYGGHYSGYGRHYGGHYGGRGYYRGGGHGHLGTGLAIVAGAVVLGSIIQASTYNNRARQAQYGSRPGGPVPDYWYRVDADGQCVEVRRNQQGREVWTYVDSSYCY
jgi:hypothetical protein